MSAPTLWRWERAGKLPSRDVFIGGRAVGWRPATIDQAERGNGSDGIGDPSAISNLAKGLAKSENYRL